MALVLAAAAISIGTAASTERIVGGTAIQIQASPSTVYVQYQDGPESYYRCTGSIIDASHVLTSAHCLYTESGTLAQASQLIVDAGLSNFFMPTSTDLVQYRTVTSFRVHPSYVFGPTGQPDDVAVLALSSALDLSGPAVKAVALPLVDSSFPSRQAVTVAGFGRQTASVPPSGPLVSMTANVDPQGTCGEYTGGLLITNDNATVMCAVSHAGSACNGDSGAGVLTMTSTPVIVGVVEAATAGCQTGGEDTIVYVGAPEILAFIQGADDPPAAPRKTSSTKARLDWNSPLLVGARIVCSTSGWKVPVHVSYSFLNEASGKVLQTGTRTDYLVKTKDVGINILCRAKVAGSGGTLLVSPLSTGKVRRK
jgi:hypothetical protein